jgi:hypothetical protein
VLEVLGEFGTTGTRLELGRRAHELGHRLRAFAAGDGYTLSASVADAQVVMAHETHTRLRSPSPVCDSVVVVVRSGDEVLVLEEAKPLPASD